MIRLVRDGVAGHLGRGEAVPELVSIPRETLEILAEALSSVVAADVAMVAGPGTDHVGEVIRERRELIQAAKARAERRALAQFGDCLPLNFLHALSLELAEGSAR